MKEVISGTTYYTHFDSITEFYDYICKTPFNDAFRWEHQNNYPVPTTYDYEEIRYVDCKRHKRKLR